MAFIATISAEAAQDAVRHMYFRQQAAWGYLPNYAKVFCHRPQVMARWGQLLAEIKRPMDKRRFELVTFVAAHELRHSACALAHGRVLRQFFSDPQILAIAEGRLEGVLSCAEQCLVGFARQVARDAAGVDRAHIASLEQHGYSDAEIFDIAAAAAGRAFFTKLLDALGVLPDSAFLACDQVFRETLSVGRAIDQGEGVRVPLGEPEQTHWESVCRTMRPRRGICKHGCRRSVRGSTNT
jgi:alkylhydroperoxidase family enzyme